MVFGEWDQDVALAVRYEEGVEKGIEEGIEKGIEKGLRLTAENLKKTGMPINQIANATGLPIEYIERL